MSSINAPEDFLVLSPITSPMIAIVVIALLRAMGLSLLERIAAR